MPNPSATLASPPATKAVRTLPLRLGARGLQADAAADLTPAQRRCMVTGILALHMAGAWGLMQVDAVRNMVLQAAPMFIDVITPEAPPTPPAPPPPSSPVKPLPLPTPLPVIAAAPSPAPAVFTVPAVVPDPAPDPAPAPLLTVPTLVATPPAPPPPAPPPAPKTIPASAVQYIEAPAVTYPRLSKRNAEAGLVVVRAYIDAAGGAPRTVQVNTSSGFARLDEAALVAVQKARFKPYTEGGRPVEGWALIPINFELEK